MERLERDLGVVVQNSWGMTELSPVGVFGVLSDPTAGPRCPAARPWAWT
jgi:long-subunit acyl-CoA synthetase (AMP-forming)